MSNDLKNFTYRSDCSANFAFCTSSSLSTVDILMCFGGLGPYAKKG